MGSNNLETKNPGDVIASSDPNQYKTALTQDHLPRNSSGVATDEAGSLGSTLYRWLRGYFTGLTIGVIASGLKIEEDSGELVFKVGDTEVARMDANGITASSFPSTGVLRDLKRVDVTATGTVSFPSHVTNIFMELYGGGGGGGGAGGTTVINVGGSGGGGGAGALPFYCAKEIAAGEVLDVTIGAGGAAGVGVVSNDGTNGGTGGSTIVSAPTTGWTVTAPGGAGGTKGLKDQNSTGAGPGGSNTNNTTGFFFTNGGDGADGELNNAVTGQDSPYASGGSPGSVAAGNGRGGPGGGGGASIADGGDGGDGYDGAGPTAGTAGTLGSGGGGGGGAGTGITTGANGGAGGPGRARFYYVD